MIVTSFAVFALAVGIGAFFFLERIFAPIAVAAYLAARSERWVTSGELLEIGGPFVYPAVRELVRRGRVEERVDTSPDALERRGGRARYAYRWRGDAARAAGRAS